MLLDTTSDPIAQANVVHTLGALRRSQGQYPQATDLLSKARKLYEQVGHQLNRARAWTDLGRTHLCCSDFAKARDCFNNADDAKADSPRHDAENALWRCWLALKKPGYGTPTEALALAETAAANTSYSLKVEGGIAVGYALAAKGDLDRAGKAFREAAAAADVPGKHRVNALLSLSQFYWEIARPRDVYEATRNLNEARDEIRRLSISSAFIVDKVKRLLAQLGAEPESVFVRTMEDVKHDGKARIAEDLARHHPDP